MGESTRRIGIYLPGAVACLIVACVVSINCFYARGSETPLDEPVRVFAPDNAAQPSAAEIPPYGEARQDAPDTAPAESSVSGATPAGSELQMPQWAAQPETLFFRVDFLGISMGYARFQYTGIVSVEGKAAYHIKVRAWTSGILSYIYPVSEAIDYYLDADTIQPIRIEYTGKKDERDDVAVYDQKNGKITYIYTDDGTIRKTADAAPSCYDPISAVYYFRSRDMSREEKPVNMYAGRKIYQITGRLSGSTLLNTKNGLVDTLVVEPVIWKDGEPYDKGEFRMWVSDDGKHVPLKIFGKFRKIKDWTLVGELIPEQPGD
ncbi:MAG: DUF3108 domain-containing protein [Syntrophorhabdaceae bacterium]|nr:DUF3108 domain-containing protein [Syntrophorhabdaceae bacterium]